MNGWPSQQQFEHILNNNLITNCPVTVDNARWVIIIYSLDVPAIKGKSVCGDAISTPTQIPSSVPSPILDDHGNITLCADFFFMQGLPFFHTISQKLKFHTVTPVKNLKCNTIKSKLHNALWLYHLCGFQVVDIHSNME